MDRGLKLVINEHYDASVLSTIPASELGLFNRIIYLPDSKPYGFWMDRHGNFIPVKGGIGSHENIAIEIIQKANDYLPSYNQIDVDEIPSFYDFLLDAGWLRIIVAPKSIYWEASPGNRPNNIQMKNLKFMQEFYDLDSVDIG